MSGDVLVLLAGLTSGSLFLWMEHRASAPVTWNSYDPAHAESSRARLASGTLRRRQATVGLVLLWIGIGILQTPRHQVLGQINVIAALIWIGWMIATWLWSVNRPVSRRRLGWGCLVAAAGLLAGAILTLRQAALLIATVSLTFLVVGVLNELRLRRVTKRVHYRFAGTLHPNGQAAQSTLLVFALWQLTGTEYPKILTFGLMAAAVAILALTRSRTSLWCFLCGVILVALAIWVGRTGFLIGVLLTLGLLAIIFFVGLPPAILKAVSLGRSVSNIASFTGRRDLWQLILRRWGHRRVLGLGFGAVWTTDLFDESRATLGWRLTDSHSTYLELALGTGIVGLVIFAGLIVTAIASTLSTSVQPLALGTLLLVGLGSLTESTLLGMGSYLFFFFVVLAAR